MKKVMNIAKNFNKKAIWQFRRRKKRQNKRREDLL